MHIRDTFDAHVTTLSFEFFPPKTPEAAEQLYGIISHFEDLKPAFVSVTYGAGGGTRELTHELVVKLKDHTKLDPIPHLTSVCHREGEIREILERYAEHNISNILALRGDPPGHVENYRREDDAFQYASELVSFIKRFNDEKIHPDPRGFGIGVAGFPEGHPNTPNRLDEMDHLKAKVDAGADYICTQLFFDNRDFFDFCERCELAGIRVPIIAGIMPITGVKSMRRMADLAAGSRYPAPLLRALARVQDDSDAVRRVGVQCHRGDLPHAGQREPAPRGDARGAPAELTRAGADPPNRPRTRLRPSAPVARHHAGPLFQPAEEEVFHELVTRVDEQVAVRGGTLGEGPLDDGPHPAPADRDGDGIRPVLARAAERGVVREDHDPPAIVARVGLGLAKGLELLDDRGDGVLVDRLERLDLGLVIALVAQLVRAFDVTADDVI